MMIAHRQKSLDSGRKVSLLVITILLNAAANLAEIIYHTPVIKTLGNHVHLSFDIRLHFRDLFQADVEP